MCRLYILHGWEWKILVLLKNKKISSRGPLSWRNSMFVSCVCKRRWRLGGRKCRKMPEAIFAYVAKRKSSSCTLYVCWNRVKKKEKKRNFDFESLVFYWNSVKLRQSPTHDIANSIFLSLYSEPKITNEKKKARKYLPGSRSMPPHPSPPQILKVETKICAIWGIFWWQIWTNLAH